MEFIIFDMVVVALLSVCLVMGIIFVFIDISNNNLGKAMCAEKGLAYMNYEWNFSYPVFYCKQSTPDKKLADGYLILKDDDSEKKYVGE